MTAEKFDWDEMEVSEIIEGLTAVILAPVVLPIAAGMNQPVAKKTIKEAIALVMPLLIASYNKIPILELLQNVLFPRELSFYRLVLTLILTLILPMWLARSLRKWAMINRPLTVKPVVF